MTGGPKFRFKPFSVLKKVFLLPKDLKLIFSANLLWSSGFGLYHFILPVYIRDLGGTILEVGLFFFSMNAIYFSSMFFGGFLADKFDRKKLILFYWIVTTPTPLIYSFATNWIHSIPGAIIFNFALGDPAVSAYVTTAAPKKRIVRAFSITHTGYSLGMIFSPLLGAYLLTAIHIRWLFITAFLLFLASTFTISHISSQTAEKNQRRSILLDFAAVVKDKRLMSWILLFIPVTFATAMSMKFISPLLEDAYSFQKPAILIFGSIISVGQAVLATFLGWFGDNHGVFKALILGLASNAGGMILLGFPASSLFLPLALFFTGAREVTMSLSRSMIAKYSSINLRGTIFGVYSVLIEVGAVCGPYVGSLLYESSPTHPFLWTSIFLVTSFFSVAVWKVLFSEADDVATLNN